MKLLDIQQVGAAEANPAKEEKRLPAKGVGLGENQPMPR